MGNAAAKKADRLKIGLISGMSSAMMEFQAEKRKNSIKAAAAEIDALNAKHH